MDEVIRKSDEREPDREDERQRNRKERGKERIESIGFLSDQIFR